MEPRLRIVTGKGGVGKTTVATAMALAAAKQGKRVLLAETHGRDQVATLLGANPVGPHMREVLERLYVVDMTPEEAIHEYVLLTLKLESLYKLVFENRFVGPFLRLIPSLGELVMLGKVWFHEQEVVDGRFRFDLIVLDAPATGHAISLLRTPSAVARTVPAGPLRKNATDIEELLTDPGRTRMHIVTLPEEMPVNEAVMLAKAADDELGIALGTMVINRMVPPLPLGALSVLEAARDDAALAPYVNALKIREGKRLAGDEHVQRLPASLLHNAVRLPRRVEAKLSLDSLYHLGEHFLSLLHADAAS